MKKFVSFWRRIRESEMPPEPLPYDPSSYVEPPSTLRKVIRRIPTIYKIIIALFTAIITIVTVSLAFLALPQNTQEYILYTIGRISASATPTATFTPTLTPSHTPTVTATFTPTHTPTATITPTSTPEFAQAKSGEILVIVAEFENRNAPDIPNSKTMAEQLNNLIDEASASVRDKYTLQLRVERTAELVTNSERARAISEANQAALLIWGNVDSAGISTYYTISTLWKEMIDHPIEHTDFTAVSSLDEVAIRFRRTIDQGYVTNFTIGQILYSGEEYEAALPLFEAAINLVKGELPETQLELNMAAAYANVGYIYQVILKDNNLALAAYNSSLTINSDWDLAYAVYNNRATLYSNQENYLLAIADYNQAILLNPGYALAYKNRGIVYTIQQNFTQAVGDFTQAITIIPDYADAYIMRSLIDCIQGNFQSAANDMQTYIDLVGDQPQIVEDVVKSVYVCQMVRYLAIPKPNAQP